jgi:hypothetical protein
MSEPKRYKLRPIFWDYCQLKSVSKDQIDAMGNESAYSHKDGDWVKWEDYARLKAEVERLTPLLGDIVSFDEYHKLLQQVERLTKAGDAMADECSNFQGAWPLIKAWNAAKEGKQS